MMHQNLLHQPQYLPLKTVQQQRLLLQLMSNLMQSLIQSQALTRHYLSIVASTGVLTFKTAPDYELTDPVADDNTYSLTVTASDGTVTVDQALTVTVTNVEGGPVFSSAATFAVDENQTAIATLTASDDENDTIAFTISGGDDSASFSLADGVLTFAASPNYEVKSSYSLTVTASETTDTDGATIASPNTTDQAITVSINDINDAAVITAADGTIAEGTATVLSYRNTH